MQMMPQGASTTAKYLSDMLTEPDSPDCSEQVCSAVLSVLCGLCLASTGMNKLAYASSKLVCIC